jgi:hypothetical protein
MNLEELLSKIENSEPFEWNSISRPTFAQDMQQVSGGGNPVPWVEIDEHHSLMVLRSDLSISIAIGLTHLENFHEDWATGFPDQRASSCWVDFRYNGVPVLRELRVLVDGARAGLPVPTHGTLEIPERQYAIWKLIDSVIGSGNFSEYFKRAGLKTVEADWPEPER